jgi:beta-fructofuranosidase
MPLTRREVLGGLVVSGAGLAVGRLMGQTPAASSIEAKLANDPMRPQFHLLPARNWMNDPNGPIYYDGKYHMFFQYNPEAAIWGNMSWNHATSPDMLHWTHQPLALTMTPDGPDAAGCFSGSCIAVDEGRNKRVYAIYTGVIKNPQRETIRNEGLQESQCLAWSDDANLTNWIKLPKPVIPAPPAGLKVIGFRDPSVWKQGNWFYMTVGSGIDKVGGCVLLYRSSDLRSWEYLHPLASGERSEETTLNPVGDGEMWECPEFFALDGGHVLIYSTMGKVFWQSGMLDVSTMKFHPVRTGLIDLDAFYAPKTQLDAQGNRILWGWIPERRPEAAMLQAGWSGMMSLPRVMNLDTDGVLRLQILPQTKNLRSSAISIKSGAIGTLREASGELLCTGRAGSDFHLQIYAGSDLILNVFYSATKHVFSADGKEFALEKDDLPTLHGFVDGSVLEVILGERIGYTKRFYYSSLVAPDLQVSVSGDGAALSLWRIRPISPNRLTTPASRA